MDLKLRGKTAIVTGGSRGIGAGITEVLAKEGCNVAVNYRSDEESAVKFAESLKQKYHVEVEPIQADVSIETESASLFAQTVESLGKVDILVNNAAGGFRLMPFQELAVSDWEAAEKGILDPVFYMSGQFLKYCLDKKRDGHIVNVLSKSAFLSSSVNNLTYVAFKGAMASLTRGMAKEFISHGIYVNGIIPGYVRTERRHIRGDERTERVRKLLPTGEFATPEEMGNIVAVLCSPLFRQMIGALVDCTGGTLL